MIPDEEILTIYLFYVEKVFLDLTFLFIYVGQKEVAQLTCDCERHIGTQSGGMDQVIFLFTRFSFSLIFTLKKIFQCLSSLKPYF